MVDPYPTKHGRRPWESSVLRYGTQSALAADRTSLEKDGQRSSMETIGRRRGGRREDCGVDVPSWQSSRRQRWRARYATTALSCLVLALLSTLILQPAAAVQVPFTNCLRETVRLGTPRQLQWEPLYVDASFVTPDNLTSNSNATSTDGVSNHRLTVTVWGNVTGSYRVVQLPPPDSPDWEDDSKTDGKILEDPLPPDAPRRFFTTLHSKVEVLTYEPWFVDSNFCSMSLQNESCPLGPVFKTTREQLNLTSGRPPFGLLPAFNLTNDFSSSYAFTSLVPTFLILYGDEHATQIGCISAVVTPDLGGLAWALRFLPLAVLVSVGIATAAAAIWSPWGTTDVFHWTSNHSRDDDLLRLVTPGFADCLQYIQFAVLTGALNLAYPGFFQPIVAQAAWSSLIFNQTVVHHAEPWQAVVDGIYVTTGPDDFDVRSVGGTNMYGLQTLARLVGQRRIGDLWAGMMVWLCVIIAGVFVLIQIGFFFRWLYRLIKGTSQQDLRAKNLPFSLGNIVRIVYNYFLLPLVALSTFQLVVAGVSEAYVVALAVVTLVILIAFSGWVLYLARTTKPYQYLFDDLPTLLLYGPLYNTFADDAAPAYATVPVFVTIARGVAIGAVQPAGIAQLVILAICEVIQICLIHAFRPYPRPTSMNLYHTVLGVIRFVTILLMVAFIPSLGVSEGPKGWIGYAILLVHAGVLVLGFFLNALQKLVEVIARRLGAGGELKHGLTRGGLSKIFGMRQLSRRMSRQGPSRTGHMHHHQQLSLSESAMADVEGGLAAKSMATPGGAGGVAVRVRRESAASFGGLLGNKQAQRSSSALDSHSMQDAYYGGGGGGVPARNFESAASSFTPTTPGGDVVSNYSFVPSPGHGNWPPPGPGQVSMDPSDPYFRKPRKRRPTFDQAPSPGGGAGQAGAAAARKSWASGDVSNRLSSSQAGGPVTTASSMDLAELEDRGSSPGYYMHGPMNFPTRTDYSTREVDFYYGVRGSALNPSNPSRKFATGPTDPTGTMASAAGWFRSLLSGRKRKEKGKGFEVVRSARMPPAMKAAAVASASGPSGTAGDFDDPPEGIPVAMGVLRNGPIDSDDEDGQPDSKKRPPRGGELLDAEGNPRPAAGADDDFEDVDVDDASPSNVTAGPMGRATELPPTLPGIDTGDALQSNFQSVKPAATRTTEDKAGLSRNASTTSDKPVIPRKSSKRHSGFMRRMGFGGSPAGGSSRSSTEEQHMRQQQQQQQQPQQQQQGSFSVMPSADDQRNQQYPQQYSYPYQYPQQQQQQQQQQYPYPYPYQYPQQPQQQQYGSFTPPRPSSSPQQQYPPQLQQQQQQRYPPQRLPFERTPSQKRVSTGSVDDVYAQIDLLQQRRQSPPIGTPVRTANVQRQLSGSSSISGAGSGIGGAGSSADAGHQPVRPPLFTGPVTGRSEDRPASFGYVAQRSISRVDPPSVHALAASAAEVEIVDEGNSGPSRS